VPLVLLSLVPLVAGTVRLVEVFGGPQLLPESVAAIRRPGRRSAVGRARRQGDTASAEGSR
jgi:hypothetical protein